MPNRATTIFKGLLIPIIGTTAVVIIDYATRPRSSDSFDWILAANFVVLLLLPFFVLFCPGKRRLGAAMVGGSVVAIALMYVFGSTLYRLDWTIRARGYVADIFDVEESAVTCRFVENTRVALACEIALTTETLPIIAEFRELGSGRNGTCNFGVIDPCARFEGYCDGVNRLRSGVQYFDMSQGENVTPFKARKNLFPYGLMLEGLYFNHGNQKACLIVNTGGSDQLRC